MSLEKVQSGQPMRIKAQTFNSILDATRAYQERQQSGGRSTKADAPRDASTVLVRNDGSNDVYLGYGLYPLDPVISPTDNLSSFKIQPVISCDNVAESEGTDVFFLAAEPIGVGKIGRAVTAGVWPAFIYLGDPNHRFVKMYNMGVSASARPSEDIIMLAAPPTDLSILSYGYLWVNGVRIAVRDSGSGLSGDFIGHEGDIATLHKSWEYVEENEQYEWVYSYTFETPPDGYIIYGIQLNQYGNYSSGGYYKRDAATTSWVETIEIGWTRKYPRMIARLDDPGENGQRARLSPASDSMSYVPFYRTVGVRNTPPENMTPSHCEYAWGVSTPATGEWTGHEGEFAYWTYDDGYKWEFHTPTEGDAYVFGAHVVNTWPLEWDWDNNIARAYIAWNGDWVYLGPGADMYEHDGTGWQFATDQFSPPDTISTYGTQQPGDYLTADNFDQIYSACLLLHRRTTLSSPYYNYRPQGWTMNVPAEPLKGSMYRSATRRKHVAGGSATEAIANWNAEEWSNSSAFIADAHNKVFEPPYTTRYLTRYQCMMYARFAEPGMNAGKNVNVGIYAIGDNYRWMYHDPGEEATWSNQGDNIANDVSVLVEAFTGVAKSQDYALSNWYGSDTAAPAKPWGVPGGPDCGYQMKAVFAVEEWSVPGGFEYQ